MSADVISLTLWHRETQCLEDKKVCYPSNCDLMSEQEWKRDIIANKQAQKNSMIFLAKNTSQTKSSNFPEPLLTNNEKVLKIHEIQQQFNSTMDTNHRILPVKNNPILCHDLENKNHFLKENLPKKVGNKSLTSVNKEAKIDIKISQNLSIQHENLNYNINPEKKEICSKKQLIASEVEEEEVKYGKGFVSKLLKKFSNITDTPTLTHSTSSSYIPHIYGSNRQNSDFSMHSNINNSRNRALSTNDLATVNLVDNKDVLDYNSDFKSALPNIQPKNSSALTSCNPNQIPKPNINFQETSSSFSVHLLEKKSNKIDSKNIKNGNISSLSVTSINKPGKLIYSSASTMADNSVLNIKMKHNKADNLKPANNNVNAMEVDKFNYEKNNSVQSRKSEILHAEINVKQCNENISNSYNNINNNGLINASSNKALLLNHYSKQSDIITNNEFFKADSIGMSNSNGVIKTTKESYLVKSKPDVEATSVSSTNSKFLHAKKDTNKIELNDNSNIKKTTDIVSTTSTNNNLILITPNTKEMKVEFSTSHISNNGDKKLSYNTEPQLDISQASLIIEKPKETTNKTFNPRSNSIPPLNSLVSTTSYNHTGTKSQDLENELLRTNKKSKDQSSRPGSLLIRPASNLAASKTDSAYLQLTKFKDIKKGEFAQPKRTECDQVSNEDMDLNQGEVYSYEFEGAGVILAKSSLKTEKLKISKKVNFDDSENIFEYPPDESWDVDQLPIFKNQSYEMSDDEDIADKNALITSITSGSGNLSSYVSKSTVEFEFGSTKLSPDRADVIEDNSAKNSFVEIETASWSNGAEMLF